jgi:hypothetical protein
LANISTRGSIIVHQIFHEDLVREPEASFQRIFEFIGESFAPSCLEPLKKRINSSQLRPGEETRGPATDPAVIDEARELWKALRRNPAPASLYLRLQP